MGNKKSQKIHDSNIDSAEVSSEEKDSLIAKKDFAIHHNDYHREIKKGDDLNDVPERYHPNLKAEGVL